MRITTDPLTRLGRLRQAEQRSIAADRQELWEARQQSAARSRKLLEKYYAELAKLRALRG
jgi:hypothetical protein